MLTRRALIQGSALAAALAPQRAPAQDVPAPPPAQRTPEGYVPVYMPNGWTLKPVVVAGAKVFHLVAEPLGLHEFAPGLSAHCWGYNGSTPGPLIEVVQGDRVRIYVTNRLPEPTTVHWHGVPLPNGMDGVAGLNQPSIPPGKTFLYEFTFNDPATYMYHSHFDEMVQAGLGMMGMIVVHPRRPSRRVDRDFVIQLAEWSIPAGAARPNPFEMTDFNLFTMNSKAFPGTEPLVAALGERVRIRFGNLSIMSHHPIHLHGYRFWVTGTDGGPIPRSAWWPETTVLVPVGTTRDIEFVADNPGDWAMHCHMLHHFMNQMGHGFPNVVGARLADLDERIRKLVPGYMTMGEDGLGGMGEMLERQMPVPTNSIPMGGAQGPFGFIDMGGMMTVLKVRRRLDERRPREVGWYDHPPGTVARPASTEELGRDRIDPEKPPRSPGVGPPSTPPPLPERRPPEEPTPPSKSPHEGHEGH